EPHRLVIAATLEDMQHPLVEQGGVGHAGLAPAHTQHAVADAQKANDGRAELPDPDSDDEGKDDAEGELPEPPGEGSRLPVRTEAVDGVEPADAHAARA